MTFAQVSGRFGLAERSSLGSEHEGTNSALVEKEAWGMVMILIVRKAAFGGSKEEPPVEGGWSALSPRGNSCFKKIAEQSAPRGVFCLTVRNIPESARIVSGFLGNHPIGRHGSEATSG